MRRKRALAGSHHLVADESRLSGERVCEVTIDAVQHVVDRARLEPVGANAREHVDLHVE